MFDVVKSIAEKYNIKSDIYEIDELQKEEQEEPIKKLTFKLNECIANGNMGEAERYFQEIKKVREGSKISEEILNMYQEDIKSVRIEVEKLAHDAINRSYASGLIIYIEDLKELDRELEKAVKMVG